MVNVRFFSALQIMMSLSLAKDEGIEFLSSNQLAKGLNANATAVRALVVELNNSGLIETTLGKYGGISLKKDPKQISLKEIYKAINLDNPIFSPRQDIPHRCKVTRNIHRVFKGISDKSEKALLRELSSTTLLDVMNEL